MARNDDPQFKLKRLRLIGMLVAVGVVVGGGSWAVTTEISGAVIAPGTVVVESNIKKVQHPSGGIVGDIRARDGDHVQQGQIIVRLDATITRANLSVIEKRLDELTARRARLQAERDGSSELTLPKAPNQNGASASAATAIENEKRLFKLRRATRSNQKEQLHQQIVQINKEISGLEVQAKAKSMELELIESELGGVNELWFKGLMPVSRLMAIRREKAKLVGEHGRLTSQIARSKAKIAETRTALVQIDQTLASEVALELADTDAKIGEFSERRIAARAELTRIDIRAPQSGTIHESIVHTVGGVISAGETLMVVVPNADKLLIKAEVSPRDIDQLFIGQRSGLRFSTFNQRTTPELTGYVHHRSADISTDTRTGTSYYDVRIRIPAEEIAKLNGASLVPGMPVEVFIKTEDRPVMSYLMKPLTDQFSRAFRER